MKFKVEEYSGDADKWYPIEVEYEELKPCYDESINWEYFLHTDRFNHIYYCRMSNSIFEEESEYHRYLKEKK